MPGLYSFFRQAFTQIRKYDTTGFGPKVELMPNTPTRLEYAKNQIRQRIGAELATLQEQERKWQKKNRKLLVVPTDVRERQERIEKLERDLAQEDEITKQAEAQERLKKQEQEQEQEQQQQQQQQQQQESPPLSVKELFLSAFRKIKQSILEIMPAGDIGAPRADTRDNANVAPSDAPKWDKFRKYGSRILTFFALPSIVNILWSAYIIKKWRDAKKGGVPQLDRTLLNSMISAAQKLRVATIVICTPILLILDVLFFIAVTASKIIQVATTFVMALFTAIAELTQLLAAKTMELTFRRATTSQDSWVKVIGIDIALLGIPRLILGGLSLALYAISFTFHLAKALIHQVFFPIERARLLKDEMAEWCQSRTQDTWLNKLFKFNEHPKAYSRAVAAASFILSIGMMVALIWTPVGWSSLLKLIGAHIGPVTILEPIGKIPYVGEGIKHAADLTGQGLSAVGNTLPIDPTIVASKAAEVAPYALALATRVVPEMVLSGANDGQTLQPGMQGLDPLGDDENEVVGSEKNEDRNKIQKDLSSNNISSSPETNLEIPGPVPFNSTPTLLSGSSGPTTSTTNSSSASMSSSSMQVDSNSNGQITTMSSGDVTSETSSTQPQILPHSFTVNISSSASMPSLTNGSGAQLVNPTSNVQTTTTSSSSMMGNSPQGVTSSLQMQGGSLNSISTQNGSGLLSQNASSLPGAPPTFNLEEVTEAVRKAAEDRGTASENEEDEDDRNYSSVATTPKYDAEDTIDGGSTRTFSFNPPLGKGRAYSYVEEEPLVTETFAKEREEPNYNDIDDDNEYSVSGNILNGRTTPNQNEGFLSKFLNLKGGSPLKTSPLHNSGGFPKSKIHGTDSTISTNLSSAVKTTSNR